MDSTWATLDETQNLIHHWTRRDDSGKFSSIYKMQPPIPPERNASELNPTQEAPFQTCPTIKSPNAIRLVVMEFSENTSRICLKTYWSLFVENVNVPRNNVRKQHRIQSLRVSQWAKLKLAPTFPSRSTIQLNKEDLKFLKWPNWTISTKMKLQMTVGHLTVLLCSSSWPKDQILTPRKHERMLVKTWAFLRNLTSFSKRKLGKM